MKNKRILLTLLLLAATLTLGGVIPSLLFADRSNKVGSLSPLPTATVQIQADLQPEIPPTPLPRKITNCTYALQYWLNEPENWPPEVSLGGKVYTREEAYLTLISDDEDIRETVAKEAYVALLNIYHGASPDRIETTLTNTDDWLKKNSTGSELSQFNQQQGLAFLSQLSDFNNGRLGPRPCPISPAIPTPGLSDQETARSTPTDLANQ